MDATDESKPADPITHPIRQRGFRSPAVARCGRSQVPRADAV